MDDLPEEEIEQAEDDPATGHSHAGVLPEDGTLAGHLVDVHGLDADPGLSPTTLEGLHDRLHHTSKAADD